MAMWERNNSKPVNPKRDLQTGFKNDNTGIALFKLSKKNRRSKYILSNRNIFRTRDRLLPFNCNQSGFEKHDWDRNSFTQRRREEERLLTEATDDTEQW